MKYGFIIDNRKCIGCHACTTACKAEHEVPVGVNRTWVKEIEKGTFPDTRRMFSVMRCNHCTDAPCVSICPTEALFTRDDGIVDFDNDRCIGCKSCMQACPYDALYIDPDTHTAAKCNYCAHRIDVGLEPACVNVCPEHAIISGDMTDPSTEISQLLAKQQVKVRKPEKATSPNLFYIDADDASLVANETEISNEYFSSSQSRGVGHYAKEAEKMVNTNEDVLDELMKMNKPSNENGKMKSVEVLMAKSKRTYDVPDKGILWGWEVSAYVWTKAISTGMFLVPFISWMLGIGELDLRIAWISMIGALVFLAITGILLIKDLDRPDRFLYVLLRPHWESWLVKGGYAISFFGGMVTFLMVCQYLEIEILLAPIAIITAISAVLVAIYTAFLFAQAKGRDFWQSPALSIHMFVHALMAGAAIFLLISPMVDTNGSWMDYLSKILTLAIMVNLITIIVELYTSHPTKDAMMVVEMITRGSYKKRFWIGVMIMGNILPLVLLWIGSGSVFSILPAIMVIAGIYITEHIWIEAPQKIPLS